MSYRTQENLLKAFARESQVRNRYLYYAKIAKKEGFEQIAWIFEQTADHELSHAKNFFKLLKSGETLEVTAAYPAGRLGTTIENLGQAIEGEHKEGHDLYLEFAKTAEEEGQQKAKSLFKNIAKVEAGHEARFRKILDRLEAGTWFERDEEVTWMCSKCGFLYTGTTPPQICPACFHPQGYFEVVAETF